MSVQYLSDGNGQITAVQVPINEWELLKKKYPEIASIGTDLPDWQKALIDIRLRSINEDPKRLLPIDGLFAELDAGQDNI